MMTAEEFWISYTKKGVFDCYDDAYEYFSQELSPESKKEYYYVEVLLEINGHHRSDKQFDKVLRFSELIKLKQPELFKEVAKYFDKFLIEYYCFLEDWENTDKAFESFRNDPIGLIDEYLSAFDRIVFNQKLDIITPSLENIFKQINESKTIMPGAGHALARTKYYIFLEDVHKKQKLGIDIEPNAFSTIIKDFNYDPLNEYHDLILKGIKEIDFDKNAIISFFSKEKPAFFANLEAHFLKYMFKIGFNFALSTIIWEELISHISEYNDNEETPDAFFTIEPTSYENFIVKLAGGFFLEKSSLMFAILWGTVHLYEFLLSSEIISKQTFDRFISITNKLKGELIYTRFTNLWKFAFIHKWSKPNTLSEVEFSAEKIIFKKTFAFKNATFPELRSQIEDELDLLAYLKDKIIKPTVTQSPLEKALEKSIKSSLPPQTIVSTYTAPEKIGRNAKCPCGSGKKYKKCCGQ